MLGGCPHPLHHNSPQAPAPAFRSTGCALPGFMGGGPTPSWAPAQGTFPARPWPLPTIEAGQAPTPTPNASPLRLPSVLSHPAQARVKVTVCFHCHACHDSLGPCLPASLLRPAGHPGQRGWTPMLPCHFRGRVSVQVRRPVHLTGGEARGGRADAQGLGSQACPGRQGACQPHLVDTWSA